MGPSMILFFVDANETKSLILFALNIVELN